MTIQSIQKIIKVGSSKAVTLPARDLRAAGLEVNDEVKITIEPIKKTGGQQELLQEYKAFKAQYSETLKRLADR